MHGSNLLTTEKEGEREREREIETKIETKTLGEKQKGRALHWPNCIFLEQFTIPNSLSLSIIEHFLIKMSASIFMTWKEARL